MIAHSVAIPTPRGYEKPCTILLVGHTSITVFFLCFLKFHFSTFLKAWRIYDFIWHMCNSFLVVRSRGWISKLGVVQWLLATCIFRQKGEGAFRTGIKISNSSHGIV